MRNPDIIESAADLQQRLYEYSEGQHDFAARQREACWIQVQALIGILAELERIANSLDALAEGKGA